LTVVNQGDVLMSGHWNGALLIRLILNYLTPFTVSNLGLLARTLEHK
jgi:hypothetical protein